ncbi:hypothetical protein Tco_0076675, partial [Tanacetum coccineum]
IGETSFSFSLDLAYARAQKLKESVASRRLSISDALVPIVESLSQRTYSVAPIPHTEAPLSSIVFEKEELDTTPEHPAVADVPCSRKELSIAVPELVRFVA